MSVDREFISKISGHLQMFRERGDDYNFRCPFCGDSKKSSTKARGWLKFDKDGRYYYHCFNCLMSCSLKELIVEVAPGLAKDYIAAAFKSRHSSIEATRSVRAMLTAKPDFSRQSQVVKSQITEDSSPPLAKFPEVKRVTSVDWALEYAASRCLPFEDLYHFFCVENVRDVSERIDAYKDKKFRQSRAILMPYYGVAGDISYLQARLVDESASGDRFSSLRYITFEVNGGGKLWGRHRVKNGEDIFIFEGVLDAVMIKGGVAAGGVDLLRAARLVHEEYPDSRVILCYDEDWRRNHQVYAQVRKAASLNYNMVLTTGGFKDVNDMAVKGGASPEEIRKIITSNTLSPLHARLEIARVSRPWKQ